MCLIHQTTEMGSRQGSPLSGWTEGAIEKDGPKRPLVASYKRLEKRLIRPLLLRRRQSVALYTWHRQGPHTSSSCSTFTFNSHRGRDATGIKKSCVYVHRVTSVVFDSLWPCRLWPARLLCQGGGVLQARILERTSLYLLPYPSRALYFPLA